MDNLKVIRKDCHINYR